MTDKPKLPGTISLILNDRESGSVILLNRLVSALEDELHRSDLPAEEFSDLLASIRKKLRHFAAIENFLASLMMYNGNGSAFPGEALRFIEGYLAYWKDSPEKLTGNFLKQCNPEGKTILTHSHSQTVITLLQKLHQRQIPFKVIQTLSIPGDEGKLSHERMLQMNLQAELIGDEEVKHALKHIHLVLMGCDTLLHSEFLNKAGTGSILRHAKKLNIPSFLITESRKKISSPTWKNELPSQSLFEWTPLNLVSGIITEGAG